MKRETWRDLTQSYDKIPYIHRKINKQRNNTTTQQKTLITQRLQTEPGRSVGLTTDTQLVWLNRFTGFWDSLPYKPQELCNQKDT